MQQVMHTYCIVMWLRPGVEKGILVKANTLSDAQNIVRKEQWLGRMTNIIPVIAPESSQFQYVTNKMVMNVISIKERP